VSALVGSKAVIREARWHRKLFGGGMRQAGILAAGALYALEHNISRLADDHRNARRLADTVRRTPGLLLVPDQIDSNIVIFQVDAALGSAGDFAAALRERGVLVLAIGATQIRAVTHLDVDAAAIERAATIVAETAAGQQQSAVAGDGLRAASM